MAQANEITREKKERRKQADQCLKKQGTLAEEKNKVGKERQNMILNMMNKN